MVGQTTELQGVAEAASLPDPDLLLEGEVQELAVAQLLGLGAGDELLGGLGQVGEAQALGMVTDAFRDELAHRAPPTAKSSS